MIFIGSPGHLYFLKHDGLHPRHILERVIIYNHLYKLISDLSSKTSQGSKTVWEDGIPGHGLHTQKLSAHRGRCSIAGHDVRQHECPVDAQSSSISHRGCT